jgi:L-aspartate oxidase
LQRPFEPRFPDYLGGFDSRKIPTLRTDVLVIGTGIAGATAALEAAAAGASVLCLSKSTLDECNTQYAQGGVAAALTPEDTPALHAADTLAVGAGLSDRATVKFVIDRGPEAVAWLTEHGARFDRSNDGTLQLGREGGHSVDRVVHAQGDATGAEIVHALTSALQRHDGITCRSNAFVRDLLLEDGRCVGAVVLIDSMELAVQAGAVIVATGGAGQIYRETTNPSGAGGDGPALCFRAGAELADMEFVQFHPTTLYIAGASRFLISEVVRGAGAALRDRTGHRFMQDAHPDAELAPRDVVSRAILSRMVETGDTHVYLDLRDVRGDPHASFPSISKICRAFDIDISVDPIPVRPGAHYMIGGVRTDLHGRTRVPGLFAAGECAASFLHGANRLASNSLLEGTVLGLEAGRAAAAESCPVSLPSRIPDRASCGDAPRLHLEDMLYSLKSLMWRQVGLMRSHKGLAEARERIGLWVHYLARAEPRTRAGFELMNMLTVAALVTVPALMREESRGTHYRTDHPSRDDAAWCRHIHLGRVDDGRIDARSGPIEPPSDR